MALSLTLLKYSPNVNPDRILLKVGFSGSYVAGGDTLNINPASYLDPNGVGVLGYPTTPPLVVPGVFHENLTDSTGPGAYVQVIPGATLGTYKLQAFNHGGAELSAAAYPAGFASGVAIIEVVF